MEDTKQLRHDLSNHAIKIDVIAKLICDDLKTKESVDQQMVIDLKEALKALDQTLEQLL
jgi:hypothetical protein